MSRQTLARVTSVIFIVNFVPGGNLIRYSWNLAIRAGIKYIGAHRATLYSSSCLTIARVFSPFRHRLRAQTHIPFVFHAPFH